MTVHPHGDDTGMFDVFNAEGTRYVVDLRDDVCECPDFEHREPAGGCKHLRRVRIEFALPPFEEIPAAIRSEHAAPIDAELARRRRGIGVEPEPEIEVKPVEAAVRRVVTDGGAVVSDADSQGLSDETSHAPGCDNPECEGYDAEGRPVLSWECWEVWA